MELFDQQWGIDPTGEFSSGDESIIPCMKHKEGAYNIISKQLKFVDEEVIKRSEKLKIATDAHTGLEILHLFIKDLLGRSTPAAIIFQTKADEDFEHTEVVTKSAKRLAMLALAGINIFFVYFAILTGFRRGIAWQRSYLVACIIQFMVEIVLNETMECVWIQCIIPMLVSNDVRRVGDSITDIVNDLCSNTPKDSRLFLNAPEYLFVSTNLAKKFPTLMESIVVQSYFNHIPGELSKLWNVGSVARIRRYHNLRHITLLTIILGSIQYFGTLPLLLHRLFIRFVQPFVFGGLVLFWAIISSNSLYVALMSLVLGILVAFGVYKYFFSGSSSSKLSPITPIVDDGVKSIHDEAEDNQISVHLNLDDFQQLRDDKGSSNDSSISKIDLDINECSNEAASEKNSNSISNFSDKDDDESSNSEFSIVSSVDVDSTHSSSSSDYVAIQ